MKSFIDSGPVVERQVRVCLPSLQTPGQSLGCFPNTSCDQRWHREDDEALKSSPLNDQ